MLKLNLIVKTKYIDLIVFTQLSVFLLPKNIFLLSHCYLLFTLFQNIDSSIISPFYLTCHKIQLCNWPQPVSTGQGEFHTQVKSKHFSRVSVRVQRLPHVIYNFDCVIAVQMS